MFIRALTVNSTNSGMACAPKPAAGATWLSTISIGLCSSSPPAKLPTKSDRAMSVVLWPSIRHLVGLLLHRRQPQQVRKTAAHVIQELHRNALSASELLDEGDALLDPRALVFELFHLDKQHLQARRLLTRRRQLRVDL